MIMDKVDLEPYEPSINSSACFWNRYFFIDFNISNRRKMIDKALNEKETVI